MLFFNAKRPKRFQPWHPNQDLHDFSVIQVCGVLKQPILTAEAFLKKNQCLAWSLGEFQRTKAHGVA
jgi:hypothetical protein